MPASEVLIIGAYKSREMSLGDFVESSAATKCLDTRLIMRIYFLDTKTSLISENNLLFYSFGKHFLKAFYLFFIKYTCTIHTGIMVEYF